MLYFLPETMRHINITATEKTPAIVGDTEEGTLTISGKSLPENPRDFYTPFSDWLNEFYKTPSNSIKVVFDIEYFNTSTSNILVEILRQLQILRENKEVSVIWRYEEDDIDMEDVGNDFKIMVGDLITLEPKKPA